MENDLCLCDVRLQRAESWVNPKEGLWFVFPEAGAGEFISGAVRHQLSAKAALVANMGHAAMSIRATAAEFRFQCFQVGLETLFPLLPCREIPRLRAAAERFKTGKIFPATQEAAAECFILVELIPAQDNLKRRAVLLRVAAVLLEHELHSVNGKQLPAASAGERVRQILDGISNTELMNASVDELAQKFGYSRRHLNRLFHEQFGFSVGALRMEVRLQKATRLLRDPQAKVINVAAEAGFNHLSLFNSCFRRRFGLSPRQWRKTMLNPAPEAAIDDGILPMLAAQNATPMNGEPVSA